MKPKAVALKLIKRARTRTPPPIFGTSGRFSPIRSSHIARPVRGHDGSADSLFCDEYVEEFQSTSTASHALSSSNV